MKRFLTGLVILLSLVIISQAFIMKSTNGTEKYPYEVLKKYENFEIRKYEAANFSYVEMNTKTYRESSNEGFRILAGYIFGNNATNEKIAMTSPVAMNLEDTVTMMFMVPSEYKMEDLPNPNDKQVKFKREPEKIVAAIRFGGWADDNKIKKYSEILQSELHRNNIVHNNKFSYLGYNPPYDVINRRNEIIVEIDPFNIKGIYY